MSETKDSAPSAPSGGAHAHALPLNNDPTMLGVTSIFEAGLRAPKRPVPGFFRPHEGIVVLPDVCPAITRGVPIRPKMLDENVRANLFPEQVKGVVESLKYRLGDMTLDQVTSMESITRDGMKPPADMSVLVQVHKVPAKQSMIPWGLLQFGSTPIGSEQWVLVRADSKSKEKGEPPLPPLPGAVDAVSYRVNYYTAMDGDFFYSDVVPFGIRPSTWYSYFAHKVKGKYREIKQLFEGGENVVVLPDPSDRKHGPGHSHPHPPSSSSSSPSPTTPPSSSPSADKK